MVCFHQTGGSGGLVRLDQAGPGGSREDSNMQVRDVMTPQAICCTPETTLAAAATLMEQGRCRTLPVIHNGRPVAMITDRDICLALAVAACLPSELSVADVMSEELHSCHEEDEILQALETMRRHHVRRLPVIGPDGGLAGVLSIDDVLARAGSAGGPSFADTIKAFQGMDLRPSAGGSG